MAYTFSGGIHLPPFKNLTAESPIRKTFVPKRVVIPMAQHTGAPSEPLVKVGDAVAVGSPIAKAAGFVSSAAHATISGRVTRISYSPTPTLARVLSVCVESQGDEEQEFNAPAVRQADSLAKEELLNIIRDAGIVGLGGAAFPTHVKLSPPAEKPIDTVILNGAECEPYLTCDYRLMLEHPEEIIRGLNIIVAILGIKKAYIAVEDDKPAAVRSMEKALSAIGAGSSGCDIKIAALKTKYPQGFEKQIIKAVIDRTVPSGGLPMDVGCVVQNVATAFAVYEAVYIGKPLIERAVTLSGPCLRNPMNLRVRLGTLLCDLVELCGGFVKEPKKLIFGGPMMGTTHYATDVPITKGVCGALFLSEDEVKEEEEGVCIRCGRCFEACSMRLAPATLMHLVKKERFAEAKERGVANCCECGVCAYVCPAKIPLVDYLKFGKSKISV